MSTQHRLVWIISSLLVASTAGAAESPTTEPLRQAGERVTAAAQADVAARSSAQLADLEEQIAARLEARLEAQASRQVATRVAPPWVSPPPLPQPTRSLPARRATILADRNAPPMETGSEARTAARVRADQEPFGG